MAASLGINLEGRTPNASSVQPRAAESSLDSVLDAIRSGGNIPEQAVGSWSQLSAQEGARILKSAFAEAAKKTNPKEALEQIAKGFPLERLQDLIRVQYPDHVDGLKAARDMIAQARVYLEATETDRSVSWWAHLQAALDKIHFLLDTLFSSFGLQSFLEPAEDDFEASFRSQQIMMLLSLFSMVAATIPVLGATGLFVVGGALLSIAALSLIYPYIRPVPSSIPNGVNWSKMAREGQLDVVEGRKDLMDEIAEALSVQSSVKMHPMLVGPSGIGKTETVKAFAQAVERGDYPDLAGKQVFYINTADLVNNSERFGSGNRNLEKIRKALRTHREDVILVFDEIHLACQRREQVALADQLKTMLDPGGDSFPYVIAMTTEQEFFRDIHAGNEAFGRRFHRINMRNPSDAETKNILLRYHLKTAPEVLMQPGAVQHLIHRVKAVFGGDAIQPAMGIKILSKCIQRLTNPDEHSLDHRIQGVRDEIIALGMEDAFGASQERLKKENALKTARRKELNGQLDQLLEQKKTQQLKRQELVSRRKALLDCKAEMYRLSQKIAQFAPGAMSGSQKQDVTRFVLLSYSLIPELEREIEQIAAQLGMKVSIDPSIIDEVIEDEAQRARRMQEAIARGKAELAERK